MFDDSFKIRYKTIPVAISETSTFFPTMPHNHTEVEMLLIYKGNAHIRINGEYYLAQAGDLFFVNPLEVHSVMADRGEPYYHRCICFGCSLIGDASLSKLLRSGNLGLPWRISRENVHNPYLREKFEQLYNVVAAEEDTLPLEGPAYISLLMAYMVKNGLLRDNIGRHENTVFCDWVHQYISENYHTDITSKQAAEALNFNQSYFCRTFKKNFGMTFSEYLNFYRVSASKQLIDENKHSVSEIAFECGFTNPEYFSRSFKKYLGVVPTEYKKSIQY